MSLAAARECLRAARAITVLTGAGVSAESGIPVFRGPGGLWRNWRPEELATPAAFARDPRLVWEWYDWRRQRIASAEPNAAHHAIARMQRERGCTVVTQNVDGLHQRAGADALEIHGSIWKLRCVACRAEWTSERAPLPDLPPRCACGALARPGVVWFGEDLPRAVWAAAVDAAEHCEALLVVGTSAVVHPAATLIPAAANAGARVIEVNPDETPASAHADFSLRGTAAECVPALLHP